LHGARDGRCHSPQRAYGTPGCEPRQIGGVGTEECRCQPDRVDDNCAPHGPDPSSFCGLGGPVLHQNTAQSLAYVGFPYKTAGFPLRAIGEVSALSLLAESQA